MNHHSIPRNQGNRGSVAIEFTICNWSVTVSFLGRSLSAVAHRPRRFGKTSRPCPTSWTFGLSSRGIELWYHWGVCFHSPYRFQGLFTRWISVAFEAFDLLRIMLWNKLNLKIGCRIHKFKTGCAETHEFSPGRLHESGTYDHQGH